LLLSAQEVAPRLLGSSCVKAAAAAQKTSAKSSSCKSLGEANASTKVGEGVESQLLAAIVVNHVG